MTPDEIIAAGQPPTQAASWNAPFEQPELDGATWVPAPDFFIVGAPRAGSTALHEALAPHPEVHMSRIMEPKFFLCDGPTGRLSGPGDAHDAREWIWRPQDYEKLFRFAGEYLLTGESTSLYLWSRDAQRRIADANPSAKLIAVVRDPVERAYSNWTHLWCDGLEPEADFLSACEAEERRIAAGWAPFWRYIQLGLYGEQLQHLLDIFPRDQLLVLRYRDLVDEPARTLDRICNFLGIAEGVVSNVPPTKVSRWVEPTAPNRVLQRTIRAGASIGAHLPPGVWRTASQPLLSALHRGNKPRPPLDPEHRLVLIERFRDDLGLLSEIMGESYDDWLGPVGRGAYSTRTS
jgi:hypothetical protein